MRSDEERREKWGQSTLSPPALHRFAFGQRPWTKRTVPTFRHLLEILRGILDEITDQSAYRRHLLAHGVVHSPDEWRKFCDERYQAVAKRPRCC